MICMIQQRSGVCEITWLMDEIRTESYEFLGLNLTKPAICQQISTITRDFCPNLPNFFGHQTKRSLVQTLAQKLPPCSNPQQMSKLPHAPKSPVSKISSARAFNTHHGSKPQFRPLRYCGFGKESASYKRR